MGILIGSGGAFGAIVLLHLIALMTNLFWYHQFSFAEHLMPGHAGALHILAAPVMGSLIIGVMARFGSEKIRGHGIPEAIEAILYSESRMSPKVAVLKPLSSAVSIGSGGPFGAEGPIIMTGGAIGSLFAQLFHLSAVERKTLLVAGAAAGMTAIFNAPIAAVLLALEVLLFEWKPRSFIPVVSAVLVSWSWRNALIGTGAIFPFPWISHLQPMQLIVAVGIGALTGVVAVTLSKSLYRLEEWFHQLPVHWMWWPALGSVVVGVGGILQPRVLGAGYASIQNLLDGSLAINIIVSLLLVKSIVWLVSLGSGTSGGVVAPLLIIGGAVGAVVAYLLPGYGGMLVMAGMAGILSGAMRAPLTGTLFAIEVTGHFDLLPVALGAAVASYALSVLMMPRSIFTERLARRGHHIVQEFATDTLETTKAQQIMTTAPETLPVTMPMYQVIALMSDLHAHHHYPVVNAQGRFIAVVSRKEIIPLQLQQRSTQLTLQEFIGDEPQISAHADTLCSHIADYLFNEEMGMVVVTEAESGQVKGVITRHDIFRVRYLAKKAESHKVKYLRFRKPE
ncbi:TPA: chloride channel protein [Klebsiella pneumoniae]|nr:chloride channel protein [Klebsiella pneumoniae]HBQ8815020.1 chloride channel protein [Klebsiella quasipneumoniae]HBR1356717.1 chloride channel protein [Klebsiella quasipneumoniae subsp. quasipneumoniae]HDH7807530.1 chloride channel protein [Raoultella ornithinolytica]HDZ9755394.1 chloride channel protein [Klebsiella quasipneumoniae subsp. similipneumoniae]